MIFTSYFSNYRKFPKNIRLISIARFTPSWFTGEKIIDSQQFSKIAPTKKLLFDYKNEKISTIDYIKTYLHDIHNVDIIQLYKEFDNSIFICYEKNNDFCHRMIIRRVFNSLNLQCNELE